MNLSRLPGTGTTISPLHAPTTRLPGSSSQPARPSASSKSPLYGGQQSAPADVTEQIAVVTYLFRGYSTIRRNSQVPEDAHAPDAVMLQHCDFPRRHPNRPSTRTRSRLRERLPGRERECACIRWAPQIRVSSTPRPCPSLKGGQRALRGGHGPVTH